MKTMDRIFIRISVIALIVFVFSCSKKKNESQVNIQQETVKKEYEEKEPTVEVAIVKYGDFNNELIINGKLVALKKAELRFEHKKKITNIYVKNGNQVKRGKVIASLESYDIENELQKSKDQLNSAKLDLQDRLIGYGYNLQDTLSMDKKIVKASKIKSGYDVAYTTYKAALHKMKKSKIVVPFNGVIANMDYKLYQEYDYAIPFCLLIDNSVFEVEFSVIDSEFQNLTIGRKVNVIPYSSSETYEGKISEINPFVNENGLIKVKAVIKNKDKKLVEGMSVQIIIKSVLKNQIIIPKTAVVLRSGKQVVFTYKDQKANWNYVDITSENTTEYAIKKGLKKDDEIIISGNLSLSHSSKVLVNNNPKE